jgi:hypothetical protein
MMCANLSLHCSYSYAPDEGDWVVVFIAGHPLTPDTCYYGLRLWTLVWIEAFQLDCVQSDVHWMCMLAVQLSLLDL